MGKRVGVGEWRDVDPAALRSWSHVRRWDELDYFISARGSMITMQATFAVSDAKRAAGIA